MVYAKGTTLEICGGLFMLLQDWDTSVEKYFPLKIEGRGIVTVAADILPINVVEETK